jgi:hypothetical protein
VVALRARRRRIDALIEEIARPTGAEALATKGIEACSVLDLDRVLRKIERVDRDLDGLARAVKKPEGIIESISADLGKVADALANRELHGRRERHVAELGLALLATDPAELTKRAPALVAVADRHREDAVRVDHLFHQLELVEEELARRAREGKISDEKKDVQKVIDAAGELVGSAGRRARDKIKDLSKSAAKAAARQSGKAMWGLARGAWRLGTGSRPDDDDDEDEASRPSRRARRGKDRGAEPTSGDVPALIRDLARLRDEGLLSEEEFLAKKKDLLGRL